MLTPTVSPKNILPSILYTYKAITSSKPFFFLLLYGAFSGGFKSHYYIRLSVEIKSDLKCVLNFFNGVAYFPDAVWEDSTVLQLFHSAG